MRLLIGFGFLKGIGIGFLKGIVYFSLLLLKLVIFISGILIVY